MVIIYIASMNMRGKRASAPEGYKINVTSAQSKASINREHFSPMTNTNYKGFYCFENYWQAGKVYKDIDHSVSYNWFKAQTSPKRRYPYSNNVMYGMYNGKKYDYISARKDIYVKEYYDLIKNSILIEKYRKLDTIIIYDFDGPRNVNGDPKCELVTLELLKNKINDPTHPFGHGYIVAATILGYQPHDYVKFES